GVSVGSWPGRGTGGGRAKCPSVGGRWGPRSPPPCPGSSTGARVHDAPAGLAGKRPTPGGSTGGSRGSAVPGAARLIRAGRPGAPPPRLAAGPIGAPSGPVRIPEDGEGAPKRPPARPTRSRSEAVAVPPERLSSGAGGWLGTVGRSAPTTAGGGGGRRCPARPGSTRKEVGAALRPRR